MKIKIRASVLDYEGKEILVPEKEGGEKPLTFFEVFINSLNGQTPNEAPLTAEKKNQIYQISKKIYSSNEPNFTTEQLTLIKERVGKSYAPMIYGKVCDVIDGGEVPEVGLTREETMKQSEEASQTSQEETTQTTENQPAEAEQPAS